MPQIALTGALVAALGRSQCNIQSLQARHSSTMTDLLAHLPELVQSSSAQDAALQLMQRKDVHAIDNLVQHLQKQISECMQPHNA